MGLIRGLKKKKPEQLMFLMQPDLKCKGDSVPEHICSLLRYPSGAAGGGVSASAAAAAERAAAPRAERSTNLHPKLAQDRPVAEPAVLCHRLSKAEQPGRQPIWPAGQHAPQTWGK